MTSQPIPDVQRAWITTCRGKPAESLKLVSDWPVSKDLHPEEVLVKVQAAALNPVYAYMLHTRCMPKLCHLVAGN